MGFWHRAKVMLGLADDVDEEYDEYDDRAYADDDEAFSGPSRGQRPSYESIYSDPPSVHPVRRDPDVGRARDAAPLRTVASPYAEADPSPLGPR